MEQLEMIYPENRLASPPAVRMAEGYVLRQYRPEDLEAYCALMAAAGFKGWDREKVEGIVYSYQLPQGFFLAEHRDTGALAATAMSSHTPSRRHPGGGQLSWVAAHPDHRGKHLGRAVTVAALRRHISAGYRRIFLSTGEGRLPAVKTYLRVGYEPFLFAPDMPERWRKACEALDWPYTPQAWPSAPYDEADGTD